MKDQERVVESRRIEKSINQLGLVVRFTMYSRVYNATVARKKRRKPTVSQVVRLA